MTSQYGHTSCHATISHDRTPALVLGHGFILGLVIDDSLHRFGRGGGRSGSRHGCRTLFAGNGRDGFRDDDGFIGIVAGVRFPVLNGRRELHLLKVVHDGSGGW